MVGELHTLGADPVPPYPTDTTLFPSGPPAARRPDRSDRTPTLVGGPREGTGSSRVTSQVRAGGVSCRCRSRCDRGGRTSHFGALFRPHYMEDPNRTRVAENAAAVFEALRPRLVGVAYGLLGTIAEAEAGRPKTWVMAPIGTSGGPLWRMTRSSENPRSAAGRCSLRITPPASSHLRPNGTSALSAKPALRRPQSSGGGVTGPCWPPFCRRPLTRRRCPGSGSARQLVAFAMAPGGQPAPLAADS
jgi:hypothetical protein